MTDTVHIFEAAGLGKAPFRVVGFERRTYQACPGAPIQVGGSCEYCYTGIKDTYLIRSADGRDFVVGSSCVNKTGDKGLMDTVKRHANKLKRDHRGQRENERIREANFAYLDNIAFFHTLPHPKGFKNRETGKPLTMCDFIEWMYANAGQAGRLKTAKLIERKLAEREEGKQEIIRRLLIDYWKNWNEGGKEQRDARRERLHAAYRKHGITDADLGRYENGYMGECELRERNRG
jgi:hypothetical protein